MGALELNCPYCYNDISTLVETDKMKQQFIEDCSLCRHPIEYIIECDFNEVVRVMVNQIAQ